MSEKMTGTVKWFDAAKGFGFIDANGQDYFVHFKSIVMDGYRTLKEGQAVSFASATTDRGLAASEVELLDAVEIDD